MDGLIIAKDGQPGAESEDTQVLIEQRLIDSDAAMQQLIAELRSAWISARHEGVMLCVGLKKTGSRSV
jgi:hypothetical protein